MPDTHKRVSKKIPRWGVAKTELLVYNNGCYPPVAKLDIAVDSDSKGRGFESLRADQKEEVALLCDFFFFTRIWFSPYGIYDPCENLCFAAPLILSSEECFCAPQAVRDDVGIVPYEERCRKSFFAALSTFFSRRRAPFVGCADISPARGGITSRRRLCARRGFVRDLWASSRTKRELKSFFAALGMTKIRRISASLPLGGEGGATAGRDG